MKKVFKYGILILILFVILDSASIADIDFKGVWNTIKAEISEVVHEDTSHGMASYYSDEYHGRLTSNGEVFDQNKFTAAHKTLPFDTKVKVVNLTNDKSVLVRINDRGPFKMGRVIDLSKAAARELDMMSSGLAEVKLEVINK